MRNRNRMAGSTLAVALLLAPSVVVAAEAAPYPPCERTPSDAEVSAAKGAFQAGNASFNEADYQRAITYWEDAYRRDCTAHPLLLNLARVYELDGQREKAVVSLETYVARNPGSPDEAQIRRRIEKLREQLASDAQVAPAPAPTPVAPAPVAPPPAEPAPAEEESGSRPFWPLIVGGVGVTVAIVGGVLMITGSSTEADVLNQCPRDAAGMPICPTTALEDEGNAAVTQQHIGVGLLIGGAVVGAAGIVYYFVQPRSESAALPGKTRLARPKRPEVTPWAGPGTAGLSVTGQF